MLKLTKLKKKGLDIQRKLFFPKGTVLELLRLRANAGMVPLIKLKDGWFIRQSENLDTEDFTGKRGELGVPVFQIVEITDRPDVAVLFNTKPMPTHVRWDGRIAQIETVEPPISQPKFWRLRVNITQEKG